MKKYLAYLLLVLSARVSAQISVPERVSSDSTRYSFGFNASHDIQASALNTGFFSKLLRGGLIDDELKAEVFSNHKDINRLGREFQVEVFLATPNPVSPTSALKFLQVPGWGCYYEAGYYSVFSGSYSNDLFGLAFYGNKNYLGDTAKFSGTTFKYMDFQTIGLGMFNHKSKSFFTLNLVNVQHYLSSGISKGELYSPADSTQIDLALKGELQTTSGSKFSNGLGVALNLCLNVKVPWGTEKEAVFQFRVKNLGLAKVNQISTYEVDTNIRYNGFTLDDLIHFDKNKFDGNNWLDTLNVRQDTISKWVSLPAMIQFGKILMDDHDGRLQSFFGVKIYPSIKYVPKVYAGLDFKISKAVHLGTTAAYGGFGNLRFGLYSSFQMKKVNLGIGTEDIYGALSKKGNGQMINIRLKCNI